jgi:heme oxygenase
LSGYAKTETRSESFRFVLRHETRMEHDRLDRHPAFASLLGGTMRVDGYRKLMIAFHDYYRKLDPMVREACWLHGLDRLGFDYEARTTILEADLAMLGAQHMLSNDRLADDRRLHLDSVQDLGGTLYVFEGSLLGGATMCQASETLLTREGYAGNGYWRWCREAGGQRWAMTCQMLDRLATTEEAKHRMIEAARAAFRSFAERLENWDRETLQDSCAPC